MYTVVLGTQSGNCYVCSAYSRTSHLQAAVLPVALLRYMQTFACVTQACPTLVYMDALPADRQPAPTMYFTETSKQVVNRGWQSV